MTMPKTGTIYAYCKRCGAGFPAGYIVDGVRYSVGELCEYCRVMPWAARSWPEPSRPPAQSKYERAQDAADREEELDRQLNGERWTTPD